MERGNEQDAWAEQFHEPSLPCTGVRRNPTRAPCDPDPAETKPRVFTPTRDNTLVAFALQKRSMGNEGRYGGMAQGRRESARLRVRLPAKLVTRTSTHHAILCDVATGGAQVLSPEPLAPGCELVLEWGRFDAFGEVVWCGAAEGPGWGQSEGTRCGVAFFDPLDPAALVATRVMDDGARLPREGELVRQVARRWVEGSTRL